jgi:hypothetical protein
VLRTVAQGPLTTSDIRHHFSVQFPEEHARDLEEILETHKDVVADEQGRLSLTETAQKKLQELGRQPASDRRS